MIRIFAARLIVTALCCSIPSSTRICAQTATSQNATQDAVSIAPRSDVQREFRFLSTNKVATMEKELNELAAQGFRLERVSKSSLGDELATLVAHDPAAQSNARYEYKLISTRRTGTMEKEIMEAADGGFELRGLTPLFRPGIAVFIGDETVVVMERSAGETARRYDYKLLSTRREKTMQDELDKTVAEGYTPLEMVLGQDNGASSILLGPQFVNTIILGRPAGSSSSGNSGASVAPREYKFLTTSKVGTMEREMNRAVKEGYRFYLSAPDLRMLMYRERDAKGAATYQYKLLATRKIDTMRKELSEQGELGFNYLATTSGLGGLTTVLERDSTLDPKANRREYKLLATSREKTAEKEIADAVTGGYQILDLTTIGKFILVLGRNATSTHANAN